jgi:hypothetical protein
VQRELEVLAIQAPIESAKMLFWIFCRQIKMSADKTSKTEANKK